MRPIVVCPICGAKEEPGRWRLHNPPVLYKDWCYCCSFWRKFIDRRGELCMIRCDARHWMVEGDLEYGRRGWVPGTSWQIVMLDGRVFSAANLTCQGGIPPRFSAELANNAVSVTKGTDEVPGLGNLIESDEVWHEDPIILKPAQPHQETLF